MKIDHERLLKKISYIKEQVDSIKHLTKQKTKEDILSDPWLVKGIKYSLQTAIEAMIDTAYHISAKMYNRAPSESREAFIILAENGVISHKDLTTYSAMIGFRNRVVHGYQEVQPERVIEIANNELDDFKRYLRQISELLKNDKP